MRCPKEGCDSTHIVKSPVYGFSICYKCGCELSTRSFLEKDETVLVGDEGYTSLKPQPVEIEDTHPLLNPDSKHYNMFDGLESIEVLESVMTTIELMAWCRGNIYKYRLRLGNKDNVESEIKKIRTYEAYYKYLKDTLDAD